MIEVFSFISYRKAETSRPLCFCYSEQDKIVTVPLLGLGSKQVCEKFLDSLRGGVVYYAHNLIADLLVFFTGLIELGADYNWFFLSYELYRIKIKWRGKVLELRCSSKLIPMPLENFYPALSDTRKPRYFPEKLFKGFARTKCLDAEAEFTDEDTLLDLGAASISADLTVLKSGVTIFFSVLESYGVGDCKSSLTCGSIALKHFVRNYNTIELDLPVKIKNVVRSAYHGGRCEVFGNKRPKEKILHFDFHGMYQHCMLGKVPHGSFDYVYEPADIKSPGFYYVEACFRSELPVLPLKRSKLLFPDGYVSGWYWFEEVQLALEISEVKEFKVRHGLIAKGYSEALAPFVTDLGRIRAGNCLPKELSKLLINSFYGRLGLGDTMEIINLRGGSSGDYLGAFGGFDLVKSEITRKTKSNVAVAAVITSRARTRLYQAFRDVADFGGRVLYCDTDSVFAAFPENSNPENRRIGEHVVFDTSLRDTRLSDALFALPKTYSIVLEGGEEVTKVRGLNTSGFSFNEFKERFSSRRGLLVESSESLIRRKLGLELSLKGSDISFENYDKRLWSPCLTETSPIFLKKENKW